MGSLLSMMLTEQTLSKLTKLIYTCQGKKLFSLNQFLKKFHWKILRGQFIAANPNIP
jgi:hypothetical protein